MADVESKITKSVSYQFVHLFISGLAGVFFIPFIISSLGKEQYGLFEIAFSINIINVVLDIGVGSTITNYTKKYYDKGVKEFSGFFWTYFWVKIFLSLIGFLVCILIANNVQYIFNGVDSINIPILKKAIFWFAIGVLIKNLNTFIDGVVNGFVRFDLTSFASIISKVFYLVGFFVWFYLFEDNTIVGFCLLSFVLVPASKLLVQVIQTLVYLPNIITYPKWINVKYIKETLSYLGGISFVTIFAQLFKQGAQTMLSLIAGPALVAEFGILRRIIQFVGKISSMLIRPIMPAAQDLREKYSLKDIIIKGTRFHAIVVTSLTLMILVNAEVISTYYLNSEFLNFRINLFIFALQMLMPNFAVMLMLYYNEGKSKMSVQFNICNTLFSLTLAYFGLKYFGLTGFLGGLTLGYATCMIVQFARLTHYFNVGNIIFLKIYLKRYITIVFSFTIYVIVTYLIGFNVWGFVIWNFVIVMILAIVAWNDISKGLRKQILGKII
jgi:O-antigen/teichoic acid export membrane protein